MASPQPRARNTDTLDPVTTAGVKLYPYQRDWILDDSRFKLSVKARQIGITFGTTLRHIRRRIKQKGTTVWVSASERQSKEAIEYTKVHSQAVKEKFDYDEIEFPGTDEKAQQITFHHNAARIIAMPANPDTIRGFSGDVVLDEFAFHRDPAKIWKAATAIVSRGHSLEVISTPNGQQGKYWDTCNQASVPGEGGSERTQWTKGIWSVHWADVYLASRQGCPIDIVQMKEAAGDEDTWLQEYCCVFLADAANYIPMELIVACESDQAGLELVDGLLRPGGNFYLGVDIGRKKDRTVIWLLEKIGDVFWTRAVITLDRTPFRAQFEEIDRLLPFVRRACIDATGIGAQIAEEAVAKHGEKVEAVEFNIANKEAMATDTKSHFEERTIRIPAAAPIRRAFNAVKRFTSPTGHFRFDADRTEAGHADEFWAGALALAAGKGPALSTDFISSGRQQAHAQMGAYLS